MRLNSEEAEEFQYLIDDYDAFLERTLLRMICKDIL